MPSLLTAELLSLMSQAVESRRGRGVWLTAPWGGGRSHTLGQLEAEAGPASQQAWIVSAADLVTSWSRVSGDSKPDLDDPAPWVDRLSRSGPALLAIDDVQLASPSAIAFLKAVVGALDGLPLLLVLAVDDSVLPPALQSVAEGVRQDRRWVMRKIAALPDIEVARLLADHHLAAHEASVLAIARGNPGHALRAAALAARGETVPTTLEALAEAEVAALGTGPKELAQTLAVMESPVPERALTADGSALETVTQAGLIARSNGFVWLKDPRVVRALALSVAGSWAETRRQSMGRWAAAELERLTPGSPVDLLRPLVVLARAGLSPQEASLWTEVLATAEDDDPERIRIAAQGATGIRRLVLQRRLADRHVYLGQPLAALAAVEAAARITPTPSPMPSGATSAWLLQTQRSVLDRWESLAAEDAVLGLETARAEALTHLVRKDEATQALEGLERRLAARKGPAVPELWARWIRAWGWFCQEILGRPDQTRAACVRVRQSLGDSVSEPKVAMALVRAEVLAASRLGHTEEVSVLAEEYLRLAESSHDLREGCLAWNTQGIVLYGRGELETAGAAFGRAMELARQARWLRREAISSHNWALVLTEQGQLDTAWSLETRYGQLSVIIGNHAGKAEAPLVLAGVALARGAIAEADALIAKARRVAEENGWSMLLGWARALAGRARLQAWLARRDRLELARARSELAAALETLEEHAVVWTEELDPGEVYAFAVAALSLSGQRDAAMETLDRGKRRTPISAPIARQALAVGEAFVLGRNLTETLSWFEKRGYRRRIEGWTALGAAR
jgi:tetratricopeptide (TPR) repeat protein